MYKSVHEPKDIKCLGLPLPPHQIDFRKIINDFIRGDVYKNVHEPKDIKCLGLPLPPHQIDFRKIINDFIRGDVYKNVHEPKDIKCLGLYKINLNGWEIDRMQHHLM